jgi:hypothetical protein
MPLHVHPNHAETYGDGERYRLRSTKLRWLHICGHIAHTRCVTPPQSVFDSLSAPCRAAPLRAAMRSHTRWTAEQLERFIRWINKYIVVHRDTKKLHHQLKTNPAAVIAAVFDAGDHPPNCLYEKYKTAKYKPKVWRDNPDLDVQFSHAASLISSEPPCEEWNAEQWAFIGLKLRLPQFWNVCRDRWRDLSACASSAAASQVPAVAGRSAAAAVVADEVEEVSFDSPLSTSTAATHSPALHGLDVLAHVAESVPHRDLSQSSSTSIRPTSPQMQCEPSSPAFSPAFNLFSSSVSTHHYPSHPPLVIRLIEMQAHDFHSCQSVRHLFTEATNRLRKLYSLPRHSRTSIAGDVWTREACISAFSEFFQQQVIALDSILPAIDSERQEFESCKLHFELFKLSAISSA